jgi:manganese transport protein
MLYIAIGILGATVMPHNLYLHSSIVQTRKYGSSPKELKEAIRFATIDSTVALMFALFINAAILIMAAATFHHSGNQSVAEIGDAYKLLSPLLGTTLASILFAVALLCSGQNSTLTGHYGQIVMEGFQNIRCGLVALPDYAAHRVVPAIVCYPMANRYCKAVDFQSGGAQPAAFLRSLSVGPVHERPKEMHEFVNLFWLKSLARIIAVVIGGLNAWLLIQTVRGWIG